MGIIFKKRICWEEKEIILDMGKTCNKAFKFLKKNLISGKNTFQLKKEIEKILTEKYYLAFPICFNVNNIVTHFTPTKENNYILKKGDVVSVDLGVYDFYYTGIMLDSCRTFEIETNKFSKEIEISKISFLNGFNKIKKGEKINLIGKALEKEIKKNNLHVSKFFGGHGLMTNILHSKPLILNYDTKYNLGKIKENRLICLEPLFYLFKDKIIEKKYKNFSLIKINKLTCKKLVENKILRYLFNNFRFRWFGREEVRKDILKKFDNEINSLIDEEFIEEGKYYELVSKKNISFHYEDTILIIRNKKLIIVGD